MQKRIRRTSVSRSTGQARACKHITDRNRALILIARPKCIWLRADEMRGQAEKYRKQVCGQENDKFNIYDAKVFEQFEQSIFSTKQKPIHRF